MMAVQTDQLDRWKSCLPGVSSKWRPFDSWMLMSLPSFLQLKLPVPANSCLESSAPCMPHNLLLGDEKNSQEDVYFSLADYRVDVCADKIPNSETVRLKFLLQAPSTGNCGFSW